MQDERFFNYYVELLTSTLHDAIGKNLVFQTQAKIAKEDLDSVSQSAETLSLKLEEYKGLEETVEKTVQEKSAELNTRLQEINSLVQERDAAKNEASHVQAFRNELISAKQLIQRKELEINRLVIEKQQIAEIVRQEQELKIKELEEKIQYLQLTPAQKKKYDAAKQPAAPQVNPPDVVPDNVISRDGGSF